MKAEIVPYPHMLRMILILVMQVVQSYKFIVFLISISLQINDIQKFFTYLLNMQLYNFVKCHSRTYQCLPSLLPPSFSLSFSDCFAFMVFLVRVSYIYEYIYSRQEPFAKYTLCKCLFLLGGFHFHSLKASFDTN